MADMGVEFYPLSFVPEGADVVIGRTETGTYAVLPGDGAELLRRLEGGSTVAEAAAWYERSFGEPVDVDDFLESLSELGFIRAPGSAAAVTAAAPRFQWLGRALFSTPAWLVYGAVAACALIELVRQPGLRPSYSQVYFTGSLVVVEVTLLLGQIPLAFLHEAYHVLAGQRLGLHSRLGISNRYNYVVFETRTNGLFSVPRRQRYLPFLAGMLIDTVVVGALDLTAALLRNGHGSTAFVGRTCLALSFSVLARLGWQLLLHLRTDLYYVLSTALNCHDLHEASRSILVNRLRRLSGRTTGLIDETQWTDRDRKIGGWYGWLIAFGFTGTVVLAVFVTGPVAVTYAVRTGRGLLAGTGTWHFLDSLVALLIFTVQIVLPAALAWRKRSRNAGRKPKLLTA
ncbi:PqqD family protein [Streptomyces sp. SID13666]|uniref:PqqD family protein n=1 Tax=unclassified Streptomyces TaxID=2593676 RepID=UPI0013BF0697|nr:MULTISPECIES: PqqD family protein [unclassified Streptomyces]NEA56519.1 PqqD family protein [Streptomyces sp. SID13666]NEA72313.1 PqqD family protein [Streptomyces sp. SID13588]